MTKGPFARARRPAEADRDYPPLARSIRDGLAVRTADIPALSA